MYPQEKAHKRTSNKGCIMTKGFITEDFLLQNKWAKALYHDYAEGMGIIDYHCHLNPADIAQDRQFDNLTQVWLYGDHYKWRAMRANGVPEKYCTGSSSRVSDYEKFEKWAETVPCTVRNPLYHWSHLELKRYFGIDELLGPDSSQRIYDACNEKLRSGQYSCRGLMRMMNVKLVCTTDDPLDSLEYHKQIRQDDSFDIQVLPAWRPDRALAAFDVNMLNSWLDKLAQVSATDINSYDALLAALQKRHDYFAEAGCRLSDYGLGRVPDGPCTKAEADDIFNRLRSGQAVSPAEVDKYQWALLVDLATMDAEAGWVQQLHLGALRNNNSRMYKLLGADAGFDSIGDMPQAKSLSRFLDTLDEKGNLARTILYNLNPRDNEVFATMAGNFQDGSTPGKMQYGAAWWFLDQKDGMEKQINTLSNLGLLSRFVGMLTDSRSFLSYPRHEYFRRILCNIIGSDMAAGLLPQDTEYLGRVVQDICYFNARKYFGFETGD